MLFVLVYILSYIRFCSYLSQIIVFGNLNGLDTAKLFHLGLLYISSRILLNQHHLSVLVCYLVIDHLGTNWQSHFGSYIATAGDLTIVFDETLVAEVVHVADFTGRDCAPAFEQVVAADSHLLHDRPSSFWVFSSNFVHDSCFFFDDIVLAEYDGATSGINKSARMNNTPISEVDISLDLCGLANDRRWRRLTRSVA